jgi:DNA-binding transcriptional regulator YdaS (Cro superfamily)
MPKADWGEPLKMAMKAAGGEAKLAAALGISLPALYDWRRIPPARVLQIEAVTGVRREILRPDLYPPEKPRKKKRRRRAV